MSQKIAVITGSHKGLGFEIASQLAGMNDMHVVVTARRPGDAETAKNKLRAMGLENVDGHLLDVANDDSVRGFADWLDKTFGRADILINNAGVNPFYSKEEESVLTAKPEILLDTINTNAAGMLRISQALIPMMKRNGFGRIVNVSTEMACLSRLGNDFFPVAPSYRASKIVMNAFTVLLARELRGSNILVNSYSPGWMKTDMGGPNAPFTVQEGAQTAIYLATLPDNGPSGGFFAEMRKIGGPFVLPW